MRARRAFRDVYEEEARRDATTRSTSCGSSTSRRRPTPASSPACATALVAALDAAGLPTVHLPERSTDHDRHRRPPPPPPTTTSRRTSASARPPTPSPGTSTCSAPSRPIRYTGDDGRIGHAELTIGGAQIMLSDEYPELGVRRPRRRSAARRRRCTSRCPTSTPSTSGSSPPAAAPAGPPQDEAYGARSFSDARPVRAPLDDPDADRRRRRVEEIAGGSRGLHDHRAGSRADAAGRSSSGTSRSPCPTRPPAAASTASCSAGRPSPATPATSTPTSPTPSCRSG